MVCDVFISTKRFGVVPDGARIWFKSANTRKKLRLFRSILCFFGLFRVFHFPLLSNSLRAHILGYCAVVRLIWIENCARCICEGNSKTAELTFQNILIKDTFQIAKHSMVI